MATPRIFVSHSHQDNAWCSQFVDALALAGFDVWFNKQGLYVGDQWISRIETELESRDVFLMCSHPRHGRRRSGCGASMVSPSACTSVSSASSFNQWSSAASY